MKTKHNPERRTWRGKSYKKGGSLVSGMREAVGSEDEELVQRQPKTKGMHPYRFKNNPEEKRFAEAWAEREDHLGYLLDPRETQQGKPPEPAKRDVVVAATVIQWLGSPVGQCFLRDLGYIRSEK